MSDSGMGSGGFFDTHQTLISARADIEQAKLRLTAVAVDFERELARFPE